MIYNNILEAMGNTPLIRLKRMAEKGSAQILVKFEGLNVGGSIKTRTAYNMIRDAEEKGLIHDAGNIGACIEECLNTALKMAEEDPRVFVPQQFENPANPAVHRSQTAIEILEQADCPIDGFCSGIGTGGTITGIGEVLKEKNPHMEIWAVEPEHAAILSGGSIGTHLQMGIGDGLIPAILNTEIYDDICIVTDEEAIQTSRDLAAKEGIMCGISSGTNVAAAIKLARKLGEGKTVVTVLPDTAERYFSTPLFEE